MTTMSTMTTQTTKTALVIGASRGIGLAVVEQLQQRGWEVIATVRSADHALPSSVQVEQLDINEPAQILRLCDRLGPLDLLWVNAGKTDADVPVGDVATDVFVDVMITNALSPMRVVETLGSTVAPTGTIAVTSSRQGSISMNTRGGHEVYRASKSALNQLMRSYAARTADDPRTVLLLHPGWVRTELGGSGAPLSIDESVHGLVDVVEKHAGDGGLQFLDHQDQVVPW